MKKYIICFLLEFLICFSIVYAKDNYISVSYIEQSEELRFIDFVQISVASNTDMELQIQIKKSLLPFSHVIEKKVIAYKQDNKYEFTFIDSFGNKAYGYIKVISPEVIEFFLDCKKFSDEGKDLARLYGDVYLLTKNENPIDPEIFISVLRD